MTRRERQWVVAEVLEDLQSCSTSSSNEEERKLYDTLRKLGLRAAKEAIRRHVAGLKQ